MLVDASAILQHVIKENSSDTAHVLPPAFSNSVKCTAAVERVALNRHRDVAVADRAHGDEHKSDENNAPHWSKRQKTGSTDTKNLNL